MDVETGIEFQPGDIVIDTVKEEIAWEIVWTGKLSRPDNRYMPYTENGLIKCIKDGMLLHISNE